MAKTHEWFGGQRVMTTDGVVCVVVAVNDNGQVIGLGPFDRTPRLVRPVYDAWGGEHDCSIANAA